MAETTTFNKQEQVVAPRKANSHVASAKLCTAKMLSRIGTAPVRSAAIRLLVACTKSPRVINFKIHKNTQKLGGRHFHQTPSPALGFLENAQAFVSRLTLRAEASHILVRGTDAEYRIQAVQKLLQQDNTNKSLAETFAQAAARVSDCPSGQQRNAGSLGEFGRYSMVPEFDTIVFAQDSQPGVVYGPIQTKFGYHLILIHKRSDLDA